MAAIADCNKAIKNMGSNDGADELKQLMKLTEKTVQNNERAHPSPRVHTAQTLNSNKAITRSMDKDITQVPRVPLTAVPGVDRMTRKELHDFSPNNQMLVKHKNDDQSGHQKQTEHKIQQVNVPINTRHAS